MRPSWCSGKTEGGAPRILQKAVTAREIIEEVAKARQVEHIVRAIVCHDRLTPTEEDGCQLIYEYLLNYPEEKVRELHDKGQLGFFIYGIARRQFLSNDCRHYREHRRFTNNNDGEGQL